MAEITEERYVARKKREEYRERYNKRRKEMMANKAELREKFVGLVDVIVTPGDVDMREFCGTEQELEYAIEQLYANDGRDFDPGMEYPPSMLSNYGKDYALHARGIYYRDHFSEDLVVSTRKIWTPSPPQDQSQSRNMADLRARAATFANHSRRNEMVYKSEYAWEADAWSDVFRDLRDDPCLAMWVAQPLPHNVLYTYLRDRDKYEYVTLRPDTDPATCHLTGTSNLVRRIPDATFGLATTTDRDACSPTWISELQCVRLEQLMQHPNYGLISDPRRLDIDLTFPFMVYEAKGWSGDCRAARRQACEAAAVYLDMLDELARGPGRVGSPRPYQTKTSHHYQVFVLTSFGAYWHLLVGYRRPRLPTEHAGKRGMSENVYIFQKIWSGHVIHEGLAEEFLSLIDQIHLWAITEFRTFVLEHLRPWLQHCDENFLLEWDSKYDSPASKKRKRGQNQTEELMVPSWVGDLDGPSRAQFRRRATLSLQKAIQKSQLLKGKSPSHEGANEFTCMRDGCDSPCGSVEAYLDHIRRVHGAEDREVAQIGWLAEEERIRERVRARQERGVMATGFRWPGFIGQSRAQADQVNAEEGDSSHRRKRRKRTQ